MFLKHGTCNCPPPSPPLSAPSPAPSHGLATASLLDHDSGRLPYYVQSLLEKF